MKCCNAVCGFAEIQNVGELKKYRDKIECGEYVKVLDCDCIFRKIGKNIFHKMSKDYEVIDFSDEIKSKKEKIMVMKRHCAETKNIKNLEEYQDVFEVGKYVKVVDSDCYFIKIDDKVFHKIPNDELFKVTEGKDNEYEIYENDDDIYKNLHKYKDGTAFFARDTRAIYFKINGKLRGRGARG